MNKNNMLMQMPEITGIRMFSAGPETRYRAVREHTANVTAGFPRSLERTIVRIPDM
jgi:hypothetical protein